MAWEGSHSHGFPAATRRAILDRDPICRHPGCQRHSDTADHIIPVAEGGTNDAGNGQGLCATHHAAKTQAEAARGRARNAPRRQPEPHPGLA